MTTTSPQPRAARPLPAVIPATAGAGLKKPVAGQSHWLIPLALLSALAFLPARIHATPPRYAVTDLGTLGGNDNRRLPDLSFELTLN
ncbi:MAG: hypothetical protein NTW21_39830 [Verrucomicrobia bacterium]|nr:hypothetical protein [Verrucomicrobiota bacterium]